MIENAMIDYNDGNWHGWNGGECPVHPKSAVEAVLLDVTNESRPVDAYSNFENEAGFISRGCWLHSERCRRVIAFRVTKPYVEPPKPREFWINFYDDAIGSRYSVFENEQRAIDYAQNGLTQRIHVREVIEE